MNALTNYKLPKNLAPKQSTAANDTYSLNTMIANSWSKIAPSWPLENLVAFNPMSGFENIEFKAALNQAKAFFQQPNLPRQMQAINRLSIKWLQAFFDEGQATIKMPMREFGLLKSTIELIEFDQDLHQNDLSIINKIKWLKSLESEPNIIISNILKSFAFKNLEQEQFLTLMLTTLPGWAAYIQYRTNWKDQTNCYRHNPISQAEYLAFRLTLTYLLWPNAQKLLVWHKKSAIQANNHDLYNKIITEEKKYQTSLLSKFSNINSSSEQTRSFAQLVFCIDVREEPFRRALEAQGNYQTFGFAGFFGMPVSIENSVTKEKYTSCPVLLKPAYHIQEKPECTITHISSKNGYKKISLIKRLYQSLKYSFATPFSLVETLGLSFGILMGLKSFAPKLASRLKAIAQNSVIPHYNLSPDLEHIPFNKQVDHAALALKTMGLTNDFAPLVVFCAHGSSTTNNAFASALDCGACMGRHGAPNARVLAKILNSQKIREAILAKYKIQISNTTYFLAAEHNTTTDEVAIFYEDAPKEFCNQIKSLEIDLAKAKKQNNIWRNQQLGLNISPNQAEQACFQRASDWGEVRPEWGLAKNASFIVAPRWFTKNIDLEGRSFLHSYEWEQDLDGKSLTNILTAPMIVAHNISTQYLFSTIDNVAFGAGSKVTKNITGKIGIMQGNASDLMHGLAMQSVYQSDNKAYHQPLRLSVLVYAPKAMLDKIIKQQDALQKLFKNGWVHLFCIDPDLNQKFKLKQDLSWDQH